MVWSSVATSSRKWATAVWWKTWIFPISSHSRDSKSARLSPKRVQRWHQQTNWDGWTKDWHDTAMVGLSDWIPIQFTIGNLVPAGWRMALAASAQWSISQIMLSYRPMIPRRWEQHSQSKLIFPSDLVSIESNGKTESIWKAGPVVECKYW